MAVRQPKQPPPYPKLLAELAAELPELIAKGATPQVRAAVRRANDGYWNWEECSYRAHLSGLDARRYWLLVKLARSTDRRDTNLFDTGGRPFWFRLPPTSLRTLHLIDTQAGGTIGAKSPLPDGEADRVRYLLRSLREEAISSSQIEGAVTTRDIAEEMLLARRIPTDRSEQMILNNYLTIRFLNARRHEPMTPARLCEVQRRLTTGTLDDPTAAGRFRRADEQIAVYDEQSGEAVHVPPPADTLPGRLDALCRFANGPAEGEEFVHPVVRAVLLHFWLAYDHPFADGNGRTARALFYWAMLRQGYWLAEYLTISTIINERPRAYYQAFLDTEMDDRDLTYFLAYHLSVIEQSVRDLYAYLDEKLAAQQRAVEINRGPYNPRQKALLLRARTDPGTVFTFASHANSHGIALNTAKADLTTLEGLGLLRGNRIGRRFEFTPAPDIVARLKKLARRR